VFNEIAASLYNNYLVISLSAVNSLSDESDYFSLLMILNYVNGTDSFIDISPYLIENINNNGEYNQTNFISKLKENIKIENNIFGYELVNQIKLIDYPSSLNFYNIVSGNIFFVNKNEILSNDCEIKQLENILKNSEDIFYIEYQFIVKEPPYEKFNLYPIEIVDYPAGSTADQSSEFQEKTFYSKVNKVSFKLCNEICENCYYLGTSNNPKCLTCINNTVADASGNCFDSESDTTTAESNNSDNTDSKETEDIQETDSTSASNEQSNVNTDTTQNINIDNTETTQNINIDNAETTDNIKKENTDTTETSNINVCQKYYI
jgi:hypothetical protein